MTTPIIRLPLGSAIAVTAANAVASGAYSVAADKLQIDNATNNALLADFELIGTFATAPVGGSVQLIAMDWTLDGSGSPAPAAPASSVLGRFVGSFSPSPNTANAVTSWTMRLDKVSLNRKCDYYIYNNGTGFSLNSGWVLRAQPWSPGT